jgi:transposase-like protein
MKPVKTQIQSSDVQCPRCKAPMQLVRQIDLKGLPDIYIFYCSSCQHVETVKEGRAA